MFLFSYTSSRHFKIHSSIMTGKKTKTDLYSRIPSKPLLFPRCRFFFRQNTKLIHDVKTYWQKIENRNILNSQIYTVRISRIFQWISFAKCRSIIRFLHQHSERFSVVIVPFCAKVVSVRKLFFPLLIYENKQYTGRNRGTFIFAWQSL